jgi:hypothetical protein
MRTYNCSAPREVIVALARAVNENVELAVFNGREVVIAAQIASPERLKGVSRLGKSFSLHASSIGKAVLAQLPDERVRELLPRSLHRFTPNTLVRRSDLLTALATIRQSHIAVDLEEHDAGICSIATAIVGTGALQAIAVVIPTRRFAAKADLAIECLGKANHRYSPASRESNTQRPDVKSHRGSTVSHHSVSDRLPDAPPSLVSRIPGRGGDTPCPRRVTVASSIPQSGFPHNNVCAATVLVSDRR